MTEQQSSSKGGRRTFFVITGLTMFVIFGPLLCPPGVSAQSGFAGPATGSVTANISRPQTAPGATGKVACAAALLAASHDVSPGQGIERIEGDSDGVRVEGRASAGSRILLSIGQDGTLGCGFSKDTRFVATLRRAGQGLSFEVRDTEGDSLLRLTKVSTETIRDARVVFRSHTLNNPSRARSMATIGLAFRDGSLPAYLQLHLEPPAREAGELAHTAGRSTPVRQ